MTDQDTERIARLEQIVATTVQRVYALEMAAASGPPGPIPGQWMQPPATRAPRPAADNAALESKLGTYWLSRIGIVSLITGAALLVLTYFAELGPALRVAAGYAMAAAVVGLGHVLAKRHATFGRVVLAGGLAIGYFVTYALHFVPVMRVIDSEPLGVALVALAIAGIVGVAHRLKSETVAGVALFLGLHTGALGGAAELSLACTTLLAAGAGFFIVANRWVIVPISTVVAVYTTHAMLALGTSGAVVEPGTLVAFLALDFSLFAAALLLRPDLPEALQSGIAILNWLGAFAIATLALRGEGRDAELACAALFAVAQAVLAGAAWLRAAPSQVVSTLLALALVSAAVALPIRLDGWSLFAGWLALALGATAIARLSARPGFGGLALVLAAAASLYGHVELDDGARVVAVLAWLAIERLHAPRGADTLRPVLVACVALALGDLGAALLPDQLAIVGVLVAFALFGLGFAARVAAYRWTGFAALAITASRFVLRELPGMSAGERIATFVIAGVVLLAVSYAYTRTRKS